MPPGRWVVAFAVDYHWSEWFDNTKKFSKADVIEVTQFTPSFTGIDARLRLCSRTVPDLCFPKHHNDQAQAGAIYKPDHRVLESQPLVRIAVR